MIFYTGAIEYDKIQNSPSLSTGGYKSSTTLPNGGLNNLFPTITQSTLLGNKRSVRMIVLHNLIGADLTNLKIWTEDGQYSSIEFCCLYPGRDHCNNPVFEKVINDSLPYQGTFAKYQEENPFTISNLAAGDMIGIWLKKELKLQTFNDFEKGVDLKCMDLSIEEIEEGLKNQIGEDQVKIHITWGDVRPPRKSGIFSKQFTRQYK